MVDGTPKRAIQVWTKGLAIVGAVMSDVSTIRHVGASGFGLIRSEALANAFLTV